jgi:hypothetical protein|tara:strand:- start:72 stop:260 length:189 start_codon:yes stop_codon:yes gene_type:complete
MFTSKTYLARNFSTMAENSPNVIVVGITSGVFLMARSVNAKKEEERENRKQKKKEHRIVSKP